MQGHGEQLVPSLLYYKIGFPVICCNILDDCIHDIIRDDTNIPRYQTNVTYSDNSHFHTTKI